MKNGFTANYYSNDGIPDGGHTTGVGITIAWQRGPLRKADGTLGSPNGAFVEDVIDIARDWLKNQQSTSFACAENELAIYALDQALSALESRTRRREQEGRLGTHIKEL